MKPHQINEYIRKIKLLESKLGARTRYESFEPCSFNPNDIIDIQNIAKEIAQFIGLSGLTFIVSIVSQENGVAGQIELNTSGKEVFIEISRKVTKFADAILAALAHEITHKHLQIHGISCSESPLGKYENEVLTDIATVYLGFGKLMLNGCECKMIRYEPIQGGTRTVTETLKAGYLSRAQFALVYRLICAMRRIPKKEHETHLNLDAKKALNQCNTEFNYYFSERFHKPDIRNELVKQLESEIRKIQIKFGNLERDLTYLKKGCLDEVENLLNNQAKLLNQLAVESKKMKADKEYDPCLKYSNALLLDFQIMDLISEISGYSTLIDYYSSKLEKITSLVQTLGYPFKEPSSDMFGIVQCRNDGAKLRLPVNKSNLLAKCPQCNYQFIASTSSATYGKFIGLENVSLIRKLFRKLFRIKPKRIIEFMHCPFCGTKTIKGIKNCQQCRSELTQVFDESEYECDDCGSNIPKQAKFCPKCGVSIAT